LLQQLEEGRLYSILDLGPARGRNLDFWAPTARRICFEDYYCTWADKGFVKPEEGGSYLPLLAKLLSFREDARFDIVLAWDISTTSTMIMSVPWWNTSVDRARPAPYSALVSSAAMIPRDPRCSDPQIASTSAMRIAPIEAEPALPAAGHCPDDPRIPGHVFFPPSSRHSGVPLPPRGCEPSLERYAAQLAISATV
jgi:hypothetical protein